MFGRKVRGQAGMIAGLIGLLIVILVAVQTVIPQVASAVTSANVSDPGTQAMLGLLTFLIGAGIVILVLRFFLGGR